MRRGVQEVAVKKLTRTYDEMSMKQIRKEIGILKRISFDKHIVQFYGASLADPANAMLVSTFLFCHCAAPAPCRLEHCAL